MKLIVGLGNPGLKYQGTRHNFGSNLVEVIASKNSLKFSKKKSLLASIVSFDWEDSPVLIARPETYMNLSGGAVGALTRYYSIDPSHELLVVVDDVALPFGRLRLRSRGSSGGHNGLKSVDEALGTSHYARLRIGVGTGEEGLSERRLDKFVLSKFSKNEAVELPSILEKGEEACRLWLTAPISQAMTVVNS